MPTPTLPPYIFAIHEPGGESLMLAARKPGWVVFSEAIGHDVRDRTGVDFTPYAEQGLGVICRINHGYEPQGTLPHSSLYEEFARRVANFVITSRGCHIWVIGNEMNYAAERPGVVIDWTRHNTTRTGAPEIADPMRRGVSVRFNALPDHSNVIRTTRGAVVNPGEEITPELYARCYRLCRDAIRRLPGHEEDQILVGAVAPWNTQTIYPGNANGDWVQYFQDILQMLGAEQCDGFALHAYTHTDDAARVESDARLAPPFQQRHREFRVYRDFMQAVPASMRHLAAYIVEAGPFEPWIDSNTGWVQAAYADVDAWNREPGNQPVRAMALYRWPRLDRWYIAGKSGVIEDFEQALQHDYRWQPIAPADEDEAGPVEALLQDEGKRAEKPTRRSAAKSAGKSAGEAPAEPYAAAWIDDRFPDRLKVGSTITVPLTLRNAGALPWRTGSGNPVRLGYHYYRGRKQLPMPEHLDVRTDFAHDVPPGATVSLVARIALPAAPGNYTLELDLIQEGVGWFKQQGSPVLTRWLTVEDERPAPAEAAHASGARNGAEPAVGLVPLFRDVSAQLPRSGVAYGRRSLDQVRYLVISHTGADSRLGLDKIARAHIRRGYPGIAYAFVVDGSGRIFRVSALEEAAEPSQSWSLQGVNIGLAGSFQDAPPPLAQLDATGRLCAWLAQNLSLTPDAIVGLGQLTRSESPGCTFYRGPEWQSILRRQVQLHLGVLSRGASDARHAADEAHLHEQSRKLTELQTALDAARTAEQHLRSRVEQLELEAGELQRHAEHQSEVDEGRPALRDVIAQLPRDGARYRPRPREDVETVIIHQSGVGRGGSNEDELLALAEAHQPDWPGILYDFCIAPDGTIYQTQPLDEAVDTELRTLTRAVNVAFMGQFDEDIPSGAQLYSGGRLIAWLLRRFPRLGLDDVKGLSELSEQTSPGAQWRAGRRWRDDLLAAVRRAAGMVDPTETEQALQEEVDGLARQLELAQHNNRQMNEQRLRLQADNQALQDKLLHAGDKPQRFIVPPPPLRTLTESLPRHPTLRYPRRTRSQITHIAVHHTATLPTVGPMRIAELHVAEDPSRGKAAWPGIGYHYFIHADGSIDQTNDLESVAYHVYRHNSYTVGVAFAGSFMNGSVPTSAQLQSGAHLIAWLMDELNVPLARVWGHRDFPDNVTVCPGSEWTSNLRWRDRLFARIEQIREGIGVKSIRHYVLFWQRPYPGPLARRDFVNAVGYFARFRPTVGFRPEDARHAEYVTIIGGPAGVTPETEEMLRESGCKVERIAGRDEEETGRMLAELVRLDRRFRTFDVDF
ncbi:MAG: N-acetylmuramoyl-L-alanine amidase [Caldilineaceae bacterium]|nr:N-acetylmuramoyl-L-alanine amidase [Caldilineaceae bacterium]